MSYKIFYASTAEKELNKLPAHELIKVQRAINSLSEDPFPSGHIKLEGTKEKLYRIRKGKQNYLFCSKKYNNYNYSQNWTS